MMEQGTSENEVLLATKLLKDIEDSGSSVEVSVKNLVSKFKEENISTSKGISLLDLKCHMLLNYMMNATYIVLRKCLGERIATDEAVERMVELRTVMEKIRPIESKLKYHIDKLLKFIPGNVDENDPLRFRANPENLVCQNADDSEEEMETENEKKKEKTGMYEPPKLVPMHYDDDRLEKKTRVIEEAKKRALSSSIIKELHDEYYDGPEEVKEADSIYRKKHDAETKRRTEYEEEYFVRLPVSAKDKHESKKRRTLTGLNDLTHFGDISALASEFNDGSRGPSKQGKKRSSKHSKGKKKYRGKGFKKRK